MNTFNFDQAEVVELKNNELSGIDGGTKTPWESIIENAGELCATLAGFIDGLLGK